MSREQSDEPVTAGDVLAALDMADESVVTARQVGRHVGCSIDTIRRKLRGLRDAGLVELVKTDGEVTYWRAENALNSIDPDDPIFTEPPVFASGTPDLSERVDEVVYRDER